MADRDNRRKFEMDPTTFDAEKVEPDMALVGRFMKRTKIFSDVFNNLTQDCIIELCKKYNNWAPDVVLDRYILAENEGQLYDPPDYFDDRAGQNTTNPGQPFW